MSSGLHPHALRQPLTYSTFVWPMFIHSPARSCSTVAHSIDEPPVFSICANITRGGVLLAGHTRQQPLSASAVRLQ